LKLTDSRINNNQPFLVYSFPSVSHSTETIILPNQSKPTAMMPRPSAPGVSLPVLELVVLLES
jgi:hypothetical protein